MAITQESLIAITIKRNHLRKQKKRLNDQIQILNSRKDALVAEREVIIAQIAQLDVDIG